MRHVRRTSRWCGGGGRFSEARAAVVAVLPAPQATERGAADSTSKESNDTQVSKGEASHHAASNRRTREHAGARNRSRAAVLLVAEAPAMHGSDAARRLVRVRGASVLRDVRVLRGGRLAVDSPAEFGAAGRLFGSPPVERGLKDRRE